MAETTEKSWLDDFLGGTDKVLGTIGKGGAIYNEVIGANKEKLPTPTIIEDNSSKSTTAIAVTMVAVGGLLAIVLISKLIGGKR